MCETKVTNSNVKNKDDNKRTKKEIPSKIEKAWKLQTLYHEELFCEDANKSSEKARKR
jgi:hypothetical protein